MRQKKTTEETLFTALLELVNHLNFCEHGRSVWLDDPSFAPVLKRAQRVVAVTRKAREKEEATK